MWPKMRRKCAEDAAEAGDEHYLTRERVESGDFFVILCPNRLKVEKDFGLHIIGVGFRSVWQWINSLANTAARGFAKSGAPFGRRRQHLLARLQHSRTRFRAARHRRSSRPKAADHRLRP